MRHDPRRNSHHTVPLPEVIEGDKRSTLWKFTQGRQHGMLREDRSVGQTPLEAQNRQLVQRAAR